MRVSIANAAVAAPAILSYRTVLVRRFPSIHRSVARIPVGVFLPFGAVPVAIARPGLPHITGVVRSE